MAKVCPLVLVVITQFLKEICTLHGVIFEFFRIILNSFPRERPSCLERRENNRDV
jgi:hypothetical protein